MKRDWIIGICNTNCDGVELYRFHGDNLEVRRKLLDLVKQNKEDDEHNDYEYGCESMDDIEQWGRESIMLMLHIVTII
jgi:hypothetical protein